MTSADRPARVLIYRTGQLGDSVVALPALWALRAHFPNAKLVWLYDQHAKDYVPAGEVLPRHGLIDEWIPYSASESGSSAYRALSTALQIRRKHFDLLAYLVQRTRDPGRVGRDLRFFRLAGIRDVVGHRGFAPWPPHRPEGPLASISHEADHLLERLRLSGIPTPPAGQGRMDLALTNEEIEASREWLQARNAFDGPLVGMAPGSKWSSKVWPEERFIEVGHDLIRRYQARIVLFGGPEDVPVSDRLVRRWSSGFVAAGQLSVRQSAAALSFCRVLVGNDSGTMHLAAAVGTPCVIAQSAQDWPGRWAPYGEGHTILRATVRCEGCLLSVCDRDIECLRLISPSQVVSACGALLDSTAHESRVVNVV